MSHGWTTGSTTIRAISAKIEFEDGLVLEVKSKPGADPSEAIYHIQKALDWHRQGKES